jgi:hypothetical protein
MSAFNSLLEPCANQYEEPLQGKIPERKRATADTVMSMRLDPVALRRELRSLVGRCGRYDYEIAQVLRQIETDLAWWSRHHKRASPYQGATQP